MRPTIVFTSTYGRVLMVLIAVAAATAIVSVAAQSGLAAGVRAVVPAAAATLAAWAVFWYPMVEVSDAGVTIRNVLRSTFVPWPAYRDVAVRWSLEVRTAEGATVTSWAASRSRADDAKGTSAAASLAAREVDSGAAEPGSVRTERRPANAQAVARAVEGRHAALAAAGYLGDPTLANLAERAAPRTVLHWRVMVAVASLTVASVALLG